MADYLTDEEQAERLKRWWEQNGTSLVIGLVLAVGAVVGWRYYQDYRAERADMASDAYASFLAARNEAEPTDEPLAIIDTEFEGSAYHVFTLLYRAADQVLESDWEEALALLERAVDLAEDGPVRDVARLRVAKLFYQLNRLGDSEAQLAMVRSPGFEAHVAELSGDIFFARGDMARARDAYQAAIDAARGDGPDGVLGVEFMQLKLASLTDAPPEASDGATDDPAAAADDPAAAAEADVEAGVADADDGNAGSGPLETAPVDDSLDPSEPEAEQ